MKNTVVNCDKEFFEFYVNREIFNTKRTFAYLLDYAPKHRYDKGDSNIEGVEIIVRPECNQKCEYCGVHEDRCVLPGALYHSYTFDNSTTYGVMYETVAYNV